MYLTGSKFISPCTKNEFKDFWSITFIKGMYQKVKDEMDQFILTTMTALRVLPAVIFSFHILWSSWSKTLIKSNSISFVVTDRFRKIFWNEEVSAIACFRFSFKNIDADAPACPSAIANKQQLRNISSTITTSSCFWRQPYKLQA